MERIRSIIGGHGWSSRNRSQCSGWRHALISGIRQHFRRARQWYIRRAVRLELGCRGDQIPCEEATLTPYAAEAFPTNSKCVASR